MSKAKQEKSERKTAKKSRARAGKASPERTFEGLGVSPGVAVGKAHLRESADIQVVEYKVPAATVETEVERFGAALVRAQRQKRRLQGCGVQGSLRLQEQMLVPVRRLGLLQGEEVHEHDAMHEHRRHQPPGV